VAPGSKIFIRAALAMAISCGMHPRLTELFAELDREFAALQDIYAAVPPERRMTRPAPDRNRVVDRGSKRNAPEATHPIDVDPGTAWETLLRDRKTFKATALRGDGLALGTVTAPHPAFGQITLYEWIAFVGYHGARHGAQIAENEAALNA
jgi:hypothetical protein